MTKPGDELDETTWPAWRDAIAAHAGTDAAPRSYPGYPRVALPAVKPRRFGMSLDRALAARRSATALATAPPALDDLARIANAHGITGDHARGPAPSAGGLQALELYCVVWDGSAAGVRARGAPQLAPGWYHYDRAAHALARLRDGATRDDVVAIIPSLATFTGGAFAWILVGDHARVAARYTTRADRFLSLEAGHVMQNLALVATSCALSTIPLGGFFERAIARALHLPATDRVLVVGACGRPVLT